MEKTGFTGESLEKALRDGALDGSALTLVGMAKAADKAGYVSFTRAGCEHWVDIPVDMIESADHMGTRTCRDHSHPVLKLTLKEPKDGAAKVLALLLVETGGGPVQQQMGAGPMQQMGSPQGYNPQMGNTPGYPQQMGGFPAYAPQMGAMQSNAPQMGGGGMLPPGMTSAARLNTGGFGGRGGGLNAWGCWDSTCTRCLQYEYVCNGAGFCWNICRVWVEEPCERCIWPW